MTQINQSRAAAPLFQRWALSATCSAASLMLSGYPDSMRVIDTDALPADPLEALRELSRVDSELESLRRDRVEAARRAGVSWEQIGEALGMSRQSAWEYYTRDARQGLQQTVSANSDLEEEEALRIATDEVSTMRRRRRRSNS